MKEGLIYLGEKKLYKNGGSSKSILIPKTVDKELEKLGLKMDTVKLFLDMENKEIILKILI